MNIIDLFTKYTDCYLLERKNAQEVLYGINDFILKNGKPKILQTDNGHEFSNKLLNEYCQKNAIQLIHSSPHHPSTNGVVERVHQNIKKALLSQKLEKKNYYHIMLAIAYAANAQNSCRYTVTKDIFANTNEEINNIVKKNMILSQKNVNKKVDKLEINKYVLISNIYEKKEINYHKNLIKLEYGIFLV